MKYGRYISRWDIFKFLVRNLVVTFPFFRMENGRKSRQRPEDISIRRIIISSTVLGVFAPALATFSHLDLTVL